MKRDIAATPAPAADVLALLTQQHRQLEQWLEQGVASDDAAARATLLARAADELAVHVLAEEELFFPAVRAVRTEDILLEALEEHLSLKRLVADLLRLAPGDATFAAKFKVLQEQAEHHHREEEEHLFPKVLLLLSDPRRQELATQVRLHEQMLRRAGAPRERLAARTDSAAPLR